MKRPILLWLRRFRPSYGRALRFHRVFAEACSGLAYPVTIRDRSYASSMMDSFFGRSWILFPVAFLVMVVWMLISGLLSLGFSDDETARVAFIVITMVGDALWLAVAFIVVRRLGYRDFRGAASLRAELDAIRQGRRGATMGVLVLRCDDEIWRDMVAEALRLAEVAVIDVSDVTDNLRWEMDEAIRTLSAHKIVFVHDADCDADRVRDAVTLARPGVPTRMLAYPSMLDASVWNRRRQMREFAGALRVEIAERLADGAVRGAIA